MHILLHMVCFFWITGAFAGWEEEIQHHGIASRYPLIYRQYRDWTSGQSPKIAADHIKAIPIVESGESLEDIGSRDNPRIQLLPSPSVPFEGPQLNSGYPEAGHMRQGVYKKLENLVDALDRLAPEFDLIPGYLSLRVFEGLRSIKTQTSLFENKMAEVQRSNPGWSLDQVEAEAAKWVSPVKGNVPAHSTGGAVDVRVYNLQTESFLDMGSFGVIWGMNLTAPTFSEGLSEMQIRNRLFLLCGASEAGLVNYPYEWWHLSSGDRYAAYYQDQPISIYNRIE